MKTRLLLAVTFCACMPGIVFGQAKRTASPTTSVSPSCCGQSAEEVTRFSSPEEEIQSTQSTIHTMLLYRGSSSSLTPGVYLLSTSPGDHKFQATVNRRGVVTNWFVTEPGGRKIAQVNSDDGGGQVDVNRCMAEFLDRTALCEWQGTFDSRYNYGRCYWNAWLGFLTCLESGLNQGGAMR